VRGYAQKSNTKHSHNRVTPFANTNEFIFDGFSFKMFDLNHRSGPQ